MEISTSINSSDCGADEIKFACSSSQNKMENFVHCNNPGDPTIFVHEVETGIANPSKSTETPEKSTTVSPKRTMDQADLDNSLKEGMTRSSPKKSKSRDCDCGADEIKFACSSSQNKMENFVHCNNPDDPTIFVSEIKTGIIDPTKSTEPPEKSTSGSTKLTMDQTELDKSLNKEITRSPKKSRSRDYEEESQFCQLFDATLQRLQEYYKLRDDDIRTGAETIINSFRYDQGNRFSNVDFNISGNIYGYFYRYGPTAAGLTRHRVLNAIINCEEFLSQLTVPIINIVSLGSGPGCDVIGLCSALYEYVKDQKKKLKLTLVDSVKGWISVFDTVKSLTREGNYGKASLMFQNNEVCTSFLHTELPGDQEQDKTYFSALQEADIIMVNKLFSILTWDKKASICKSVVEKMKVGALVLFIDSPFYPFENLKKLHSSEDGLYEFGLQTEDRFDISIAKFSKAEIHVFMKTNSE